MHNYMPEIESLPIYPYLVQQFTPYIFENVWVTYFSNDKSNHFESKRNFMDNANVDNNNNSNSNNGNYNANSENKINNMKKLKEVPVAVISLVGEIARVDAKSVSPYFKSIFPYLVESMTKTTPMNGSVLQWLRLELLPKTQGM